MSNAQRGQVLRWLRKTHGWIGLWGAVLGLLFGLSGFLLNHRAVMKIPAAKMEESEIQLPMVEPKPANAQDFAKYIQKTLEIKQEPLKRNPRKGNKPQQDASFMGKDIKQPAKWEAEFQLPQAAIRAEYVVGNEFATVRREDANTLGFIMRLHKGVGMNAGWILLADSIAGAMMLLSLTGVLLWTKMRGSRLLMVGLCGTSAALAVLFTIQAM